MGRDVVVGVGDEEGAEVEGEAVEETVVVVVVDNLGMIPFEVVV